MKVPVIVLGVLLVSLAGGTALAALPPRVEGLLCTRSLKASMPKESIWWTAFYGERTGFFDRHGTTHQVRCFKSEAACKAWLYWAQTDWPYLNQWLPCARGFPY